jgi:bifunctional DNase/RNase
MALVPMYLWKIVISETQDQQYIVLREHDGERQFPIVIGIFEAAAIDRRVKEHPTPRPLTHDLLGNVINEMGGRLERVVVSELRDNTFYARLQIALADEGGRVIEVDARPSDAIALSVQGAEPVPIFVDDSVLDEATTF